MSLNSAKRVAVIPGDGIGKEVIPVAVNVLNAALHQAGLSIDWTWLDWGSDYFKANGQMMPTDGIAQLSEFDCIFLGAIGDPEVPDDVTLWGLLMPIRREFDLFVNLRPVRQFDGVRPNVQVPDGEHINMLIVRENTEGEYSESGGRSFRGTSREFAVQNDIFTRFGIERITRFAAEAARNRRHKVTSVTKSNGIIHTMTFWDEVVAETMQEYPDIELSKKLIDAAAADFVMRPQEFDVVVASNLYGDILSDLGSATVGSLGIAASANLSADPNMPSMFEPVHGSAPDIAGLGIANPIATIWSGVMMLEHLNLNEAATSLMNAIEVSLLNPETRTKDLRGTASTADVEHFLLDLLNNS
jgi:tartrate dehydrogenase/decarboxylase/D-malate dehydrogenase